MPEEDTGSLPDGFATTQWSLVLAVHESGARQSALEALCRVYWIPVFVFVRRCGFERADAEDLTQSFFADVLQRDWFDQASPDKGRFRGFLRTSVRHFVSRHRRAAGAEKRGGQRIHVDLEQMDRAERDAMHGPAQLEPDEAFDRAWARTLLKRSLERLQREQDASRRDFFEACRPFLLNPAEAGAYETIAHRFNMPRGSVAVAVHRLGKRFRELVRAEVAETVAHSDAVESELRHLLQAVSV